MSQAIPYNETEPRISHDDGDYDLWFLGAAGVILGLGLVMVASASIPLASKNGFIDLYYFWRQVAALCLGVGIGSILVYLPLTVLYRLSSVFLLAGIALLTLILVPGVGHEVNGSLRWLRVGPLTVQASEPMKVVVIVYVSSYLVRHKLHVQTDFIGFIKPIGVMTVVAGLLLLEPDFGATVVIFATTLGMLFLGRVPFVRFCSWGLVALATLASLAMLAPYRMKRLMTFMDPWSDPYDSGFQLTQALIAFGRGEWLGVGLGNSVQKLFYLPEVHTDFLFAVVAEELGMIGTLFVIALFMFLVWRIMFIGSLAHHRGLEFAAYLSYGIALIIGMEAFINIGVNMGLLPTKGLTLPLMSYGSNSVVTVCVMLALVCRVVKETRAVARESSS
ncbi:MAG: cell division protein FtsW [Gammaproteobacteria bacterium]|jgi:cell division protein FtsW